jgi:CRP-like cAMP-binding protein
LTRGLPLAGQEHGVGQHPFQNFMVRFKRGDTVFEEGDKGRTMFIVHTGVVGLYHSVNGGRQHLGTLEKGDFFGEMSILEGLPRTARAVAEEDAELIEINHTVFDKMIRGNIEIAVRMLRKLSIRLREADSRIAELQAGCARPLTRGLQAAKERAGRARTGATSGPRLEAADGSAAFGLEESETRIGRYDPVTQLRPDVDLTDLDLKRTVSRQHARVFRTPEGFAVVEEVGALNGTMVNETALTSGQRHPIQEGDRLSVGNVVLIFRT